jgi:hypothetical protein
MRDDFINIGSGGIRSTLNRIHGEQGMGAARLMLDMEWSPVRSVRLPGARLVIGGHVGVAFNQRGSRVVGPFETLHPIAFDIARHGTITPCRADVAVNISRMQLDALERERDGGPLSLQLHVHGYVLDDGSVQPDLNDPTTFWGHLRYDIKPAEWVEVLEHWHYAQGFLIQVPGYGGHGSVAMKKTNRELDFALSALVKADTETLWRPVVTLSKLPTERTTANAFRNSATRSEISSRLTRTHGSG